MVNIIKLADMPVIISWRRHIKASINAIKKAIALYVLKVTALERSHLLNSACNWLSSL